MAERMNARADVLFRVARRDTRLASVRYRGLIPACALEDENLTTAICSHAAPSPVSPLVAIAVKPLAGADAAWVSTMRACGIPTVVDLCDNIFVAGYGGADSRIADTFRETSRSGLVTVPTQVLKEVVEQNTGISPMQIRVVPDIVETPALLRRQKRMVQDHADAMTPRNAWLKVSTWAGRNARALGGEGPILLWFGNHGGSYASFGLSDLVIWEDALRDASGLGAQLWVVSNHRERFEAMRASLPIRSRYFEWSPGRVDMLLALADVCLVPNSMDVFSQGKSSNRALKALAAGVPVVATPTPAMRELDGGLWLENPAAGVRAYVEDRVLRDRHLGHARRIMARDFSMQALRNVMSGVVRDARSHV
jgi:hypothetical protein